MATEQKPFLDLGNPGKEWEKEHIERLTQVLKDTWDKYYPLKTSAKQLTNVIFGEDGYYKTNRNLRGLMDRVSKILQEDPYFVAVKSYSSGKYIIAREWTTDSELEGDAHSIISKSGICLMKTSDSNTTIYMHPTDSTADYGRLFWEALSSYHKEYPDKSCFPKGGQLTGKWISLPLETHKEFKPAVYYFLHYTLAELQLNIQSNGSCNKMKYDCRVKTVLRKLKKQIGFSFPIKRDLLQLLQNSVKNDIIEKKIKDLEDIANNTEKKNYEIPPYSIWMKDVFEYYCLSKLRPLYPNLAFQTTFPNDKRRPDFVVEKLHLIIDAKYKFQYRNDDTLEIKDINRLCSYLVGKQSSTNEGMYKGIFLYPKIVLEENEDSLYNQISAFLNNSNEYFTTIPISFPK